MPAILSFKALKLHTSAPYENSEFVVAFQHCDVPPSAKLDGHAAHNLVRLHVALNEVEFERLFRPEPLRRGDFESDDALRRRGEADDEACMRHVFESGLPRVRKSPTH